MRSGSQPRRYEREFLADLDSLGVRRPDLMPRVSDYVPQIIEYIAQIETNGLAYESAGSVYFDTAAFECVYKFLPCPSPPHPTVPRLAICTIHTSWRVERQPRSEGESVLVTLISSCTSWSANQSGCATEGLFESSTRSTIVAVADEPVRGLVCRFDH